MNEEVYVTNEFNPENLKGKISSEKVVDEETIINFFQKEILGHTSEILKYYDKLIKSIKSEKYPEGIEKFSQIKRMMYFRKQEKRIKKVNEKKEEIAKRLESIKLQSETIINLCAKYGFKLDGTVRRDSKYFEIRERINKLDNPKLSDEFYKQIEMVRKEILGAYNILTCDLNGISTFFAFFPEEDLYQRVSYDKLTTIHGADKCLLDPILNNCIEEKIDLTGKRVIEFDEKVDFIQESLQHNAVSKEISELLQIKQSQMVNSTELILLEKVEFAYIKVGVSANKINYMKTLSALLAGDERFSKFNKILEEELQKEQNNYLVLLNEAKAFYDKYGVKEQLALIDMKIKNSEKQGALLYEVHKKEQEQDMDTEHWKKEDELQSAQLEEKKLVGRTIMAQYLREKAFKTEAGKLKFSEYVEKYGVEYKLDTKMKQDIIMDMESNNGRKL